MMRSATPACCALLALLAASGPGRADPVRAGPVRTGAEAYGDWSTDAPGVVRRIGPSDLPAPGVTKVAASPPAPSKRPQGAELKTLPGFTVTEFASGLRGPRVLRTAPNGDVFLAETDAGRVRVFKKGATDGASAVFADGITGVYGIAFYPAGGDPRYVYVAGTTKVVRYPYRAGDTVARGPAEPVVSDLPSGGHSTRDIAFSPDGSRLYIAVGSQSNVAESMKRPAPDALRAIEAKDGIGAAWGSEENRADVLVATPDGKDLHHFANGLRNCSGLAIEPATGDPWCVTNERDALGDDLPPDYATRVGEGGFYGWPWYYIGGHEDPRHKGERPELASDVTVPDVLLQPHSAPLGIAFYDGGAFPAEYKGNAFVALHGSWNRGKRTGYKVVRLIFRGGKPTGEYEDFLTGFVAGDQSVWGRPVGVTVTPDGALLVSDDEGGVVWRVAYSGGR